MREKSLMSNVTRSVFRLPLIYNAEKGVVNYQEKSKKKLQKKASSSNSSCCCPKCCHPCQSINDAFHFQFTIYRQNSLLLEVLASCTFKIRFFFFGRLSMCIFKMDTFFIIWALCYIQSILHVEYCLTVSYYSPRMC